MSEWIKCSERLPGFEDPCRVLVKTTRIGCAVASRGGQIDFNGTGDFIDGWTWDVINDVSLSPHEVTHWQPLPPLPEQDK